MRSLIARARSLWRSLRAPGRVDAEMDEEMRFHIEMEAERLVRERKLSPAEARRRAAAAFGGVEKFKEAGRDVRGIGGMRGMALDFRLGWRMLVRSPGLTLVGGLGMAVSVAVGAGFFAALHGYLYPRLPLDEGDRVVALENWDVRANNEERRSIHDFVAWRGELKTVEQVSAFRTTDRALVAGGAPNGRVAVAEMTAAGFRVARVPPLLGRYLVEDDEREGAPPVAVIGHDVWRARFGGDPSVVGRRIQLGSAIHTVVGVMPEGFRFPMDHHAWTPLRVDPSLHPRGQGPEIFIFARLAPGATMDEARAELAAAGRRAAAAFPDTHGRLRAQVVPYTYALDDIQDASLWQFSLMQLTASLLLVVVAVNVAVLVYARTATRRGEIAVRTALGASRRRIVTQLFVEALVLSAGAAALGLLLAHVVLRQVLAVMRQATSVGFWMDFGLRPATVAYAVGLAVLAAVIVGVIPALQSTGRRLNADLRQLGGATGMRLGRTWTVLIVGQVAVAVAVLPVAVSKGWSQLRHAATRPTYAAGEFLAAPLGLAAEPPPGADADAHRRETAERFGQRLGELARRLEAEPAVAAVTFTAPSPARGRTVEVEGVPAPPESPAGHPVLPLGVDTGYFAVFGARTLAGRAFAPADVGEAGTPVVVSRAFARKVLGGGSAVGRRLRYVAPGDLEPGEVPEPPGPWHEIVGIVENLQANRIEPELVPAAVYHPVAPGGAGRATLLVRVRGADAASFAPRLREMAAALDPELRVEEVRSLASAGGLGRVAVLVGSVLVLVMGAVLLLSAAGIHALMSFTVTQRRKEIGIRTALGADPRRLLGSIFSRALGQLALGAGLGCLLGGALLLQDGATPVRAAVLLLTVAVLMLGAGLLAALGPARRGLRIHPMEALRAE